MKTNLTSLFCVGAFLASFALPVQAAAAIETRANFSTAGSAAIAEGTLPLGQVDSWSGSLEASRMFPRGDHDRWVLGGTLQHLGFSVPAGAPIPERLGAVALQLGYVRPLGAQWTLRGDIAPGFYGEFDHLGGTDVSVPASLRLVYAPSREVQWFAGIDLEPRSAHPVVGGIGLRWAVTKEWTVALLLPEPRIEYAATPKLTLFAGGVMRRGTYRLADNFGSRHGRSELDRQSVDYRELVAHTGARWQVGENTALTVSAGWMWDRRFEFTKRRLLLNGEGAASVSVAWQGGF